MCSRQSQMLLVCEMKIRPPQACVGSVARPCLHGDVMCCLSMLVFNQVDVCVAVEQPHLELKAGAAECDCHKSSAERTCIYMCKLQIYEWYRRLNSSGLIKPDDTTQQGYCHKPDTICAIVSLRISVCDVACWRMFSLLNLIKRCLLMCVCCRITLHC